MGSFGMIIYLLAIVLVMWLVIFRPQKKKQKEEQKMRENLQIGDEIVTIGGINGRIVSIKDDTIIIENPDHSKLQICNWAIQANKTVHE